MHLLLSWLSLGCRNVHNSLYEDTIAYRRGNITTFCYHGYI
jgi:hypothetical protein